MSKITDARPWQPFETAPKDGSKFLICVYIENKDGRNEMFIDFGRYTRPWINGSHADAELKKIEATLPMRFEGPSSYLWAPETKAVVMYWMPLPVMPAVVSKMSED